MILGGFIYNNTEVKFLDEVICLNLQDFLFEYEKVQENTELLMKKNFDPEMSTINDDISNK